MFYTESCRSLLLLGLTGQIYDKVQFRTSISLRCDKEKRYYEGRFVKEQSVMIALRGWVE